MESLIFRGFGFVEFYDDDTMNKVLDNAIDMEIRDRVGMGGGCKQGRQ